jgi:thiol-disulfide isomerase/thioredoxin
MKNQISKASQSYKSLYIKPLLLFCLLIVLSATQLYSQDIDQYVYDTIRNSEVLINLVSRSGLQTGEFESYYTEEYQSYKPEQAVLEQLKKAPTYYEIVIVLASWCHDSKIQVPRFLKVLDAINYPDEKLMMIAVNSNKQAYSLDVSVYDITRVPTFIVFKNSEEVGRITETPNQSLEADLLNILK